MEEDRHVKVTFPDGVDGRLLKYAVIYSVYEGKSVMCRHRQRDTYEFPGGKRECGEEIDATAERELREETGAVSYTIRPVSFYCVSVEDSSGSVETSYGKLYFASIHSLGPLHSEIESLLITDDFKGKWTYPQIQPFLLEKVHEVFPELRSK